MKPILDVTKFKPSHYKALANLIREAGRLRIDLSKCEDIRVDEFGDYIYLDFPRTSDKLYSMQASLLKHDYGRVTVECNIVYTETKEDSYSFKSEKSICSWCNKLIKEYRVCGATV